MEGYLVVQQFYTATTILFYTATTILFLLLILLENLQLQYIVKVHV